MKRITPREEYYVIDEPIIPATQGRVHIVIPAWLFGLILGAVIIGLFVLIFAK